jgi:hypothetical protein
MNSSKKTHVQKTTLREPFVGPLHQYDSIPDPHYFDMFWDLVIEVNFGIW